MIWFVWLSTALAADLTFVVVGDTQGSVGEDGINPATLPELIEDMNAHAPDVGLFCGGLVAGAETVEETALQWEAFKAATSAFTGEMMVVPGTSDLQAGEGSLDAWRVAFDALPVDDSPAGEEGVSYYRDFGAVRMVSIASDQEIENGYAVSEEGLTWLDRVLDESEDFSNVFVMTHHPVSFSSYPGESIAPDGGLGSTEDAFWQQLVSHDVTGLFAGHWNRYQSAQLGNGGDTWETIVGTGGGTLGSSAVRPYQERVGFLLVEVTGAEVVATFYGDDDEDGHYDNPLHTFSMRSTVEVPTGLVARYTFDDELPADSAPEDTRFGIDGVLTGNATMDAEGVVGQGLSILGDDDYVEVGGIDDHKLGMLGDLTASMWVLSDGLNSGEWDNVLMAYASEDLYTEDEESNYAYMLHVMSDGRLRMFWEYGNGNNVSVVSSSPADLGDGAWHHVAVVRNARTKSVLFYVDGEQLGVTASYVRGPTGASRGMLYLGADTAGSIDSGNSGEWVWSDGSEVTYTSWAPGEPNNSGGNQDCGHMNWAGTVGADWDDIRCDVAKPFICQGDAVVLPSTDTGLAALDDVTCTEESYEGRSTLFCTTPRNWTDARVACLERGLDLVSIGDAEEETWLLEQASAISSGSWFMGLFEYEPPSAIDEVCLYNQVLDDVEVRRLGALEDCVTVLEPLPPEPEDTATPDTGADDTGVDTGTDSSADAGPPEETGEPALDSADPSKKTASKEGCDCSSSAHPRALWSLLLLGLVVVGRRRQAVSR
jgi:MYXO-CTERM domain-containing protein